MISTDKKAQALADEVSRRRISAAMRLSKNSITPTKSTSRRPIDSARRKLASTVSKGCIGFFYKNFYH